MPTSPLQRHVPQPVTSKTPLCVVESPTTATKQVIELPDGKLYQRRAGGNFHLQMTVRGKMLRKTTGTNDVTKAIKQVERYRTHGIPAEAETLPTLDHLRSLIHSEAEAGVLNRKTAWTYEDKLNLLQQFCEEQGLGHLALMSIDPDLIQQYLHWRVDRPTLRNGRKPRPGNEHRRVSQRTLNNDLDHLRACFRRAQKRGWIDQEPTHCLPRDRKAARPRPRPLSRDTVNRLFKAIKEMQEERSERHFSIPWLIPLMETILSCGLRREEARMLTHEDIDWRDHALLIRKKTVTAQQVIRFPQGKYAQVKALRRTVSKPRHLRLPEGVTMQHLTQGEWYDHHRAVVITRSWVWETKSDHSERSVPIPQILRQRLEEWTQRGITEWYPKNDLSHLHHQFIHSPSPFLFPDPDGGPLRSNINPLIGEAAQRAGIPHPRLHDLRHTYATWLRQQDVPIPTLQRLLGHQDMKTTLMYADFTLEEGHRAVSGFSW